MTDKEFERYQTAVRLKEKIDAIEKEINNITNSFQELGYPRTESGWCLAVSINDSYKKLSLPSEIFWECIDLVKQRKYEELNKYKQQFAKL